MPASDNLPSFELPKMMVQPAVRACRFFNTVLDVIFYDVPNFALSLPENDAKSTGPSSKNPFPLTDFDALSDPEGSLLLFDPAAGAYQRFTDVDSFLKSADPKAHKVAIITITGVGSSALGSAAFAWDVAQALQRPVLAIVPGYGVADVVLQALGGWFGFGLHNFLHTKELVQASLASVTPKTAEIGRNLSASTPGAKTVHGAPVFRFGSGSSDVLHDLVNCREEPFELLIGHSKGALQIGNAIQTLPPQKTENLRVVTLGCPIAPNVNGVGFYQYLGLFDALGQLNMWGNLPNEWVPTWHTTDPMLPPAMLTGPLVQRVADPTARNVPIRAIPPPPRGGRPPVPQRSATAQDPIGPH
jgi:hypothetical protein